MEGSYLKNRKVTLLVAILFITLCFAPLISTSSMDNFTGEIILWESFENGFPPENWTNFDWMDSLYGEPYDGDHWAYSWAFGDVLTTPPLEFGINTTLTFWYRAESATHPMDFEVYVNDTIYPDNLVWSDYGFTHDDYEMATVHLDSFSGLKTISFMDVGGDFYGFCLDMITVTTIYSVVYVDDDYNSSTPGWQYDHFNNIQNAINAVSENGTVHVYNGTYYENLIVNKTINLIGEDQNNTIITGVPNDEPMMFTFDGDYQDMPGLDDQLTIKAYNESTWTDIANFTEDVNGFNTYFINNPAIIIPPQTTKIAFHYTDGDGWAWGAHVDNIKINYLFFDFDTGPQGWITVNDGCPGDWLYGNITTIVEVLGGATGSWFYNDDDIAASCGNSIDNWLISPQLKGPVINISSDFTTISGFTIQNGNIGILVTEDSNNNTITTNTIVQNINGIQLHECANNTIYNNYFNNTNNFYENGSNKWNISKTLGTSILGGTYLGGNYWSDYLGYDTNEDGIGDVKVPYGPGDYLPLTNLQEIIDINQSVHNRGFPIRHAADGDWGGAQNFTPTLTYLTKNEIYLRKFGTPEFNLTVELREDSINGPLLDTLVFTAEEVPGSWTWFELDFTDVTVTPGVDYFIKCPPAPSGVTTSFGYEWGYAFGNQYDDGAFWFTRDGGNLWRDLPTMYEFVFRTYGYN